MATIPSGGPRRVRSIRDKLPSGVLVGRRYNSGDGAAELLEIAAVAQDLASTGALAVPGGPAALAPIPTHTILANPTGSTATPIATTLPDATAGITWTYGATSITITLANDLLGVEGLTGTGQATRIGADAWTTRSIAGTSNRISVSNGSGVAGNPTVDIDAAYVGQTSITTLGTVTTGDWHAGEVFLGHDAALTFGATAANDFQIVTAAGEWSAGHVLFANDTSGVALAFGKSRGSASTAAAVQQFDLLAGLYFFGDDGSTNGAVTIQAAGYELRVTGTVSAGVVPTAQVWHTMNSGGTYAERMRLHASGGLSLGNTTDPGTNNLSITGNIAASAVGSNLGDQILPQWKASTAQLDKTSDTTYATITGLGPVTLQANGTYIIEGYLSVTSGAAGGIKARLSHGASAASRVVGLAYNGMTLVANTLTTATAGPVFCAQTAIITDIFFHGVVVVDGSNRTFNVQAAQNVSDAATTSVLTESFVKATRVS